ncbi:DUF1330 domain-containing protein [Neptuniibacter sp.]|uniref:DUF1330 domain-containing protein n=1 Tax=Neptuniibacter sp. TaxID=1962643 RepID=UPI00261D63E2|nr:DUF1330 domain-containing protein [Neptuniibacter sp.]MCP4595334.1 DUF1330 domain-containing protein [Neptuniibacter sp.]
MKKAYCIVNIVKIHHPEKFKEYVIGHVPTVDQYGGKFLVKGDLGEVLEGEWPNNLMVLHEFPSIEQFKRWYESEEYKPWKELRQSCADVNVILTEGA